MHHILSGQMAIQNYLANNIVHQTKESKYRTMMVHRTRGPRDVRIELTM